MTKYEPSIKEAFYPDNAGWTNDDGNPVLLLSIENLHGLDDMLVTSYDYTWLYDHQIKAYIFCFRLNRKTEYAIFFQKDHAGQLLLDREAYEEFSVYITSRPFEKMDERTNVIKLHHIELMRQPLAGW